MAAAVHVGYPRCRQFHSAVPLQGLRRARSSASFTFATKYPRQTKPPPDQRNRKQASSKGKGNRKNNGSDSQLRLPSRLRLDKLKSQQPSQPLAISQKKAAPVASSTSPASSTAQRQMRQTRKSGRVSRSTDTSASRTRSKDSDAAALFKRAFPSKESIELQQIQKAVLQRRADHLKKFELMTSDADHDSADSTTGLLSGADFANMGLHPSVLSAITEGMKFTKPTPAQALCIPTFINGTDDALLCAAETGTGKTAAYLASVMHFLKTEEDAVESTGNVREIIDKDSNNSSSISDPQVYRVIEAMTAAGESLSSTHGLSTLRKLRRPRAVIVVPSRDLVRQVSASAKLMSHIAKLRVAGVHSKTREATLKETFASSPVDLLVSTPGMLKYLIDSKEIALSQTRYFVIDEADTLFDTNFKEEIEPLIKNAKAFAQKLSRPCRFLFTTATLPKTLANALSSEFPNYRRIVTPNLHRTQSKLRQTFLRLDASTTKSNMLLDILKRAVLETNRIIVFCNRTVTCNAVEQLLKEKQYDVVKLSSSTDVGLRETILQRFTNPQLTAKRSSAQVNNSAAISTAAGAQTSVSTPATVHDQLEHRLPEQKERPLIMVATDMASRGLDTIQVGHVILYDFPQTAIDYLHRVGRTARNGGKGRVTSIITRRDASLAEFISKAVNKRSVLA
eukprot:jgi/Hompol1/121/HPOL_001830-RA